MVNKMREKLGWYIAMAVALGLATAPATRAAYMTPIVVSGFNRDVIVESNAPGPSFYSAALEFNPGEGTAYYQSGLPGKNYGLPVSGLFISAIGDSTQFQFQSFTNNNALVLSSETGQTNGTLTFATPATYFRIAILANSANGVAPATVTLHISDASALTTTYNAHNSFGCAQFPLTGILLLN